MRQQNKLPFFALFFLLSTSTFVVSVLSVGSSINDASILISEEKGKRPLEMVNNSEEGGQTSRLHYQRVEDNETPRLPNTYFKKNDIVKMNSGELKYLKGVVVRARNSSKKVKFSGCSALIHAAFGVDLTENNKRRSIKRNFIKVVDSGGLKKGELSRKSKNGGMILLDKDSTSFEKALYFGGPFVDISRDLKEENCDLKLEDLKENELELMRLIVEFTCPVWRRTGYHNEVCRSLLNRNYQRLHILIGICV